ncbi:MAG: isochorismatase family protein [Acidobacteriaceae bacterium]|jgi:nicotinamidase-related amidase
MLHSCLGDLERLKRRSTIGYRCFGQVVVTKDRVNAFAATELEMIVRANETHTLILMGIATGGVVLSTLGRRVHHCLVEKVFPAYATVTMSDQLTSKLAMGWLRE